MAMTMNTVACVCILFEYSSYLLFQTLKVFLCRPIPRIRTCIILRSSCPCALGHLVPIIPHNPAPAVVNHPILLRTGLCVDGLNGHLLSIVIIGCNILLQMFLYLIIVCILGKHLIIGLFVLVGQQDLIVCHLIIVVADHMVSLVGACEGGPSKVLRREDVRGGESLISNASFVAVVSRN